MTKKVLIIAYHFPPMAASSGIQRTLNFVRYLRDCGWESVVLSASPRAYSRTGDEQLDEIPAGMRVERAFALDAARHLSMAGRYPGFVANPDRWASWLPFAVQVGRKLIREERPSAIFSTYPIATAHLIGRRLVDWSGLPWIADFRDSMYDDGYPEGARERAINKKLDRETVIRSSRAIFTTPSTREMYARRYPELPDDRWSLIPNGYDEKDFQALTIEPSRTRPEAPTPLVLLHSGTLYPVERNPMPFFNALRNLKESGSIGPGRLRIRLRATGHDDYYADVIQDAGLQDIVEILAPLPYRAALKEMLEVDGLLLFQAQGCNHQIPAKLYEYLRAQKPIVALTHPSGDTAALLRESMADNLLPLDDKEELVNKLPRLLDELGQGILRIAPIEVARRFSRDRGAAELARILDIVAG
jgi:glycosyltransferase involved in cell wall biosynthesis